MGNPKVSVIIPTFNCARYLPEALDSVLAQNCADFETIVVNDGSTDDTDQVMAVYKDRVRYICQENRGVGAARNTGIRYARGEYAVFLDADDLILPDKLQLHATYLESHADIDVVYSNGYLFHENSDAQEDRQLFSACGMLNKSLGAPADPLRILAFENAFPIHAAMVRLRCVREVGGFDEARCLMTIADWDLWYRLAGKCKFQYLDAVLVKYRDVKNSMSSDWQRRKSAFLYLISKFESSDTFAAIAPQEKGRILFYWGVMCLEYAESQMALHRFKDAIQLDPGNPYARSGYMLTRVLGRKAVIFYHLKRRLFGARKLPGL